MAKMIATEGAQQVIDAAVQMFGGRGVVSEQPVERLYREIRALRIYEGATEVQQLIIARELLEGPERLTAMPSAHVDTFARDHLPPPEQRPEFLFELPELQFPAQLNCADRAARPRTWPKAAASALCIQRAGRLRWTYAELQAQANRIAHVLVRRHGPGARQPRAAARAQQPDAGGLLVRGGQGRRHRGGHACRCCAPRS